MRGLRGIALGAAVACALAGPAGAAIVEATFGGNWNGDFNYRGWSVDIVYDTNLATETTWTDQFGAVGHSLIQTGATPAVLSGTVTLEGWKTYQDWLGNFDTFTPIPDVVSTISSPLEIFQSDNVFLIQGYGFSGPFGPPFGINLNLGVIPFDQPGTYGNFLAGETNGGPQPGLFHAQTFTGPITLTVLSSGTPEPATWAMMLLGFLGVGAALRRRRFSAA